VLPLPSLPHISICSFKNKRRRCLWEAARVLKTQDGKGMALSSFEGKSNVVLFFYPKVCLCSKGKCDLIYFFMWSACACPPHSVLQSYGASRCHWLCTSSRRPRRDVPSRHANSGMPGSANCMRVYVLVPCFSCSLFSGTQGLRRRRKLPGGPCGASHSLSQVLVDSQAVALLVSGTTMRSSRAWRRCSASAATRRRSTPSLPRRAHAIIHIK
jgi:hypothetical protein